MRSPHRGVAGSAVGRCRPRAGLVPLVRSFLVRSFDPQTHQTGSTAAFDVPAQSRAPNHQEEHCDEKEWRQEQTQDARVAFCSSGSSVAASGRGARGNSAPLIFNPEPAPVAKREEAMSNQRSGQQSSQFSTGGGRSGAIGTQMSGRSSAADQQESTAAPIISQLQAAMDEQVVRGAKTMTTVAKSARRAADELETAAPQIAGLVRGVADRVEDYSRNLETQSAADIYQAATDFTRRQPAVVFGLAALAGFFALRTIKNSSTRLGRGSPVNSSRGEEFHGS